MTKRRSITPAERREWAATLQFYFLDSFGSSSDFQNNEIAFHGGTSLRCAWRSPRFSEDLDFMVSEDAVERLDRILAKAFKLMRERLLIDDPHFKLTLKDKSKDGGRLIRFHLVLEKEGVIGSAMVQTEFWKTPAAFLEHYKTQLVHAGHPHDLIMQMTSLIPAAEMSTVFCDKLVAFSTRPYVKWRDIFDVWWLRTKHHGDSVATINGQELKERYLHQLTAYNIPGDLSPEDSLARFLVIDTEKLVKDAEVDLMKFLPQQLWKQLYPNTVREMVEVTKKEIQNLIDLLKEDEHAPELDRDPVVSM